ncbi:MAG: DNA replication/repair protein RecF [Candidatus Berkelbacteria bacterium]|nr:DNA replication/repair protein RecF [Candidatus Berkelbacteria bacterium]
MRIKHLKLLNFRNHKKTEIDFESTNLLLGPNGSGKTGILEAIFLLSTSKSPRAARNQDLINWSSQKSFLELVLFNKNKGTKTVRLELNRRKENGSKTFSFDGVVVEPKNIIGVFKTVYFSPETLEIINGSPAERRRFIDILLSQISPLYLIDLIEYKKILINRNKLLKEIALERREKDEIIFWDMKLVEVGSRIMRTRKEVLNDLSGPLEKYHQTIVNKKKQRLEIRYHPSFAFNQDQEIESAFTERVASEINFELKYGNTLYGPHRDDIRFHYQKHDAASFCSRGEIRSIIVALKMAEADYIKKETGDKPVILLDDIFSELDEKRSLALGNLILNNYQSIISSTKKDLAKTIDGEQIKIIQLKNTVYV